jgi:DNA modification methylase
MSKLMWNISKLRNWDKNPRAIKSNKFQELKKRIKKYGQFKPVIATPDGEVIGGNMRLRAMKDLGIQEIWVSVVEPKTNAEKIEIALADNEEMGYYQEDQLAELISEYKNDIKLESFSIHLGDGVNLEDLLNKYQPEEIIEDEAPEVEEEAISELGAIYQLGNHRLMCGDSTNIEQVEMLMDDNKIDMIFTDPPYGMNLDTDYSKLPSTKKEGNKKYSKVIGDDKPFDYSIFTWIKCEEQVWFGANYYAKSLLDGGSWLVWDKRVEEKFDKMFGSGFELAWSKIPHKQKIYRHNNTLFGGDIEARGKSHPTQKPTKLCSEVINDINPTSIKILDLFGGSGSTLIACEQTKRICFMMELDPRYVDVIRKRYAKFIGKENEWQEVTPRIN